MFTAILWLYISCPAAPVCVTPMMDTWGPYDTKDLCEKRIDKFREIDLTPTGAMGADGRCIQWQEGITA